MLRACVSSAVVVSQQCSSVCIAHAAASGALGELLAYCESHQVEKDPALGTTMLFESGTAAAGISHQSAMFLAA
jgi:hypothetical protein